MKKYLIAFFILVLLGASFYFYKKPDTNKSQNSFNSADSRSKMTPKDFEDDGSLVSAALPLSEDAITNLKKNLPHSNANFSISWNENTNRADVALKQPYDKSIANLLEWLSSNQANRLPVGTLNIVND